MFLSTCVHFCSPGLVWYLLSCSGEHGSRMQPVCKKKKKKGENIFQLSQSCTKTAQLQKTTWRRMSFTNQLTSFNTGTTVAIVQSKFRSQCMHEDFINLQQFNLFKMFVQQECEHISSKIRLARSVLTSVYPWQVYYSQTIHIQLSSLLWLDSFFFFLIHFQ